MNDTIVAMYILLPVLAFASGVSGIAYELLYMRVLSSYIGSVFYVGAAILTVFFIGMALGAYLAPRYVSKLKYIELGIGLYAALTVLVVYKAGLSLTVFVSTLPFSDVGNLILFVGVTLFVPAFLIGFTIPLFSHYIQSYKVAREGFIATYILYNFGAAFSVIVVEYFLIRNFGISISLLMFASINISIALILKYIEAPKFVPKIIVTKEIIYDGKVLLAVSIISGIAQLSALSLFERIIGPLNENFALVLFVMLISISLGTLMIRRYRLSFASVIIAASFLLLVPLVLLGYLVDIYSFLYNAAGSSYTRVILARLALVSAVLIPMFVIFGATVPTMVQKHGLRFSGIFLSVAALGNAVGFLLFIFFLFAAVPMPILFGVLSLTIGCIYVWYSTKRFLYKAVILAPIAGMAIVLVNVWPTYIGVVPYHKIINVEQRNSFVESIEEVTQYKKFRNDVTIVKVKKDNQQMLLFNGYLSLTFFDHSSTRLLELLVGAIGSQFTESHDSALVLGLGTGITVSAVADTYDDVTVSEINPVMVEAAEYFRKFNNDVLSFDNVTIEMQDGLITLLSSEQKYDLILNTVTTPSYFSANKLWTQDVYEAITSRLNPGGVFVGWMDSRIGVYGTEVMINTLNESFHECIYALLTTSYYVFVCGNDSLTYEYIGEDRMPLLAGALAARTDILDVESVFKTTLFRISPESIRPTPLNTLDRPLLEYTYVVDRENTHEDTRAIFAENVKVDAFTDELKDETLFEAWFDITQHRRTN